MYCTKLFLIFECQFHNAVQYCEGRACLWLCETWASTTFSSSFAFFFSAKVMLDFIYTNKKKQFFNQLTELQSTMRIRFDRTRPPMSYSWTVKQIKTWFTLFFLTRKLKQSYRSAIYKRNKMACVIISNSDVWKWTCKNNWDHVYYFLWIRTKPSLKVKWRTTNAS